MRVLTRFVLAATDERQFPVAGLPEIAFLGRSNVGKSSVINSLVGSKVARTSSTPGRTRSINFFELRWPGNPRPELIFTDLPGYGYARVSKEISESWSGFIEPYLRKRPCLALSLVLVDVNIPPQQSDKQLLEFLQTIGRELLVVATKSDRLSGNQLQRALQKIQDEYGGARVLPYSARSGSGREELWKEIRRAAENNRELRRA
jgi:GTP-binding protein